MKPQLIERSKINSISKHDYFSGAKTIIIFEEMKKPLEVVDNPKNKKYTMTFKN